jgi:hypothetical protein
MTRTQADVARTISRTLADFEKPGVISVRPGYAFEAGWITDRPAIVVTVDGAAEGVPERIDGIPVEIRAASAAKRQRILDPAAYQRAGHLTPDTGAVPEFDTEFAFTQAGSPAPLAALEPRATAGAAKAQLPYTAPPGVSLHAVSGELTIEVSATPDSAWPVLKAFLDATTHTLSVALYDFTSAHVLSEVETALAGKRLNLTLDHPALDPTADQTDAQTVAALRSTLAAGLDQAWALERMDPLATAWIYPTAYHIKVAVQDSSRVWLSSGNWNNSNQPAIDPVDDPGDATAARSADRDWHVVVSDPSLAQNLEAFVLHDLEIAAAHNAASASGSPQSAESARAITPPFAQFFPAKTITGQMTITPLLTPDPGVYADAVLALIRSAQRTLHLQFQYIELPSASAASESAAFSALVSAVIERQGAGVEVQIIMSEYETAGYLEQLQSAGLDVVSNVKIQNNVHNKGIVVDGSTVLVSSQNWSADGVLRNRDAGLIIESADVAGYFDQLFAHDWTNLAAAQAQPD